jgi:branched-chain amino acid transport system substrate-binding protein
LLGTVSGAVGAATGANAATRSATATGTPIPIGNIGSYSGAEAASQAGALQVIKAWAKWTNAHGGLAGHPVKLYVMDDGNSATTALNDAKELVTQDNVVAIVGEQSNNDSSWASYVTQAGVPVVGGLSIDLPFVTNPDFYPSGTNVIALGYGMLAAAKPYGTKFGVLYCAEAAQCAQSGLLYKLLAPKLGMTIAFNQSVSATAPNYTAPCQVVKSSGVGGYQIADQAAVVKTVANQCKALGSNVKVFNFDGAVVSSMATAPGLQGLIATETDAPWFSQAPPLRSYHQAIAKYAPDLGPANGPNAFYAWVSGQLFTAAVQASKTSTVTPASVKAGLYALPKGTTLGGIAPPLTFTQGQATVINCYFTLAIKNNRFVTPDGLKTSCAPPSAVSPILKLLGG